MNADEVIAVGGEVLEASTAVLAEGGRLASVTNAARVRELGGTYWFVRPTPTIWPPSGGWWRKGA